MALLSSYSVLAPFQKNYSVYLAFFSKRRGGCGIPEKLTGRQKNEVHAC